MRARDMFPLSNRKSYYDRPNIEHTHFDHRLPGHPAQRNQKHVINLYVVFLVCRAVAPKITDFDMIAFANQAVPVRRLPDQANPPIHSILTSAQISAHTHYPHHILSEQELSMCRFGRNLTIQRICYCSSSPNID